MAIAAPEVHAVLQAEMISIGRSVRRAAVAMVRKAIALRRSLVVFENSARSCAMSGPSWQEFTGTLSDRGH